MAAGELDKCKAQDIRVRELELLLASVMERVIHMEALSRKMQEELDFLHSIIRK